MLQEGVTFQKAASEGRPPCLMDMWEDAVPWGQMALTALKVGSLGRRGVKLWPEKTQPETQPRLIRTPLHKQSFVEFKAGAQYTASTSPSTHSIVHTQTHAAPPPAVLPVLQGRGAVHRARRPGGHRGRVHGAREANLPLPGGLVALCTFTPPLAFGVCCFCGLGTALGVTYCGFASWSMVCVWGGGAAQWGRHRGGAKIKHINAAPPSPSSGAHPPGHRGEGGGAPPSPHTLAGNALKIPPTRPIPPRRASTRR